MPDHKSHSAMASTGALGDLLRLRSGALEAVLSPRIARLVSLRDFTSGGVDDIVVPLEEWPTESRRWAKAGAYPLIPYSNRIFNGKLKHAGRVFDIAPHPDAWPHSLHGHAHLLPWVVEAAGPDHATLQVHAEPGMDWPWRFMAWQTFELTPDALRVTMGIRNIDSESFPAGIGWHPYIAWAPEYSIEHDANWWWPHDDDYLPIRAREALRGTDPLRSRPTAYLAGWSHVRITRGARPTLRMTAQDSLSHLVVHRVPDGSYVCIEPVSHLADAFNLAESGLEETGARVLAPGQSLTGWVELQIEAGQSDRERKTK